MRGLGAHILKILRDLFTGPDGETWAIGRVYSIPVLLFGLGYPFYVKANIPDLVVYLPALAAACWALISGTNHVDNATPVPRITKD